MQTIEILSAEVRVKEGTSAKSGKAYVLREQDAALHDTSSKYPRECKWPLGRDAKPYAPGKYIVANALTVGDFGSLQRSRDLELIPVDQGKATPSAR